MTAFEFNSILNCLAKKMGSESIKFRGEKDNRIEMLYCNNLTPTREELGPIWNGVDEAVQGCYESWGFSIFEFCKRLVEGARAYQQAPINGIPCYGIRRFSGEDLEFLDFIGSCRSAEELQVKMDLIGY